MTYINELTFFFIINEIQTMHVIMAEALRKFFKHLLGCWNHCWEGFIEFFQIEIFCEPETKNLEECYFSCRISLCPLMLLFIYLFIYLLARAHENHGIFHTRALSFSDICIKREQTTTQCVHQNLTITQYVAIVSAEVVKNWISNIQTCTV